MNYYELLGVGPEATQDEIERAYRRLARKYHPDINPGDRTAERRFGLIAEAYDTLVDPARRQQYDQAGHSPGTTVSASLTFGFEGFDFSVEGASGPEAPTFGDLFADVLKRSAGLPVEGQPVRGADLHLSIGVSFEESMRGAERHLTVVRREACRACGGAGVTRVAETRCPECHGIGRIQSSRGHMIFSKACGRCHGSGRLRDARCVTCAGQGIESRSEIVVVPVTPGAADGERLRVAGKGNDGMHGGGPGDLVVLVQVAPHPVYRREGDDLHLVVPVAIHEAALGVKIDLPCFDGVARLRVPPGTQSGQRFRLHGRGAPTQRGDRGDLVAEVRLVLPALLDERSKELLREFGRINSEDVRKGLVI